MKFQVVLLLVVGVSLSQAIPLALQKRMTMLLDRVKEEHADDHGHSDIDVKLDTILEAMCKMDPSLEDCDRFPSLKDQVKMLQRQVKGIEIVVESVVKTLAKIEGEQFMKDVEEKVEGNLEDAGLGDMDMNMETETDDAVTPDEDAGTPNVDAGTPPGDAGTPTEDTETPTGDAGTPPGDAGTPNVDAGTQTGNTIEGTGINLPAKKGYPPPPINAPLDKKALRDQVLSMLSKDEIRELEEITERKLANNLLLLLKEKKEKREENPTHIE